MTERTNSLIAWLERKGVNVAKVPGTHDTYRAVFPVSVADQLHMMPSLFGGYIVSHRDVFCGDSARFV